MTTIDVDKVLESLSIKEKTELIAAIDFWHTAPLEKYGVPSIRVSDGPNGIRGTKFFDGIPSACFPNGTCLASTFDSKLLEEAGELMSVEAAHKGATVILGPTTNMQRGPLGGRGFESFSEDPYLSGIATASVVSGIQKSGKVAATIKHFVCNDLEDQRYSSDSIVSERALHEIYLEPFRIAIRESDPKCLMTSYNKVNGTHCSESHHLIQEILRDSWKWDGLLMSDWFGVYSTVPSLKEGVDIEFPGPSRYRTDLLVSSALNSKEGNLDEDDIDKRARRVLNLAKWIVEGNGTKEFSTKEDTLNNNATTSAKLRELAGEGIVLLKNENNVLPLSKKGSTVVIGPNATALNSISGGGSASMLPYYVVTPLQGIKNKLEGAKVDYTIGCDSYKNLASMFENLTNDLGKEKGAKASFYLKAPEDRTASDKPYDVKLIPQSYVQLFDYKHPLVDPAKKLFYADFEGVYTPTETADYKFGLEVLGTALLYLDGKLLIDNKTHQTPGTFAFNSGTIELTAVAHLEAGKKYAVKVEFGSAATSPIARATETGGLQVGITKIFDADNEIKHAAELAKSHDNVILCIGLTGEWESEGYDRDDMSLPRRTNDLVKAVLKANPNAVVVNQSGTPVEFPWLKECSALVQAYYGGDEMGNAIADILFGDRVPSGKLSLSWPLKVQDNPAFLNFTTEDGRVLYGEDVFVGYRYYEKLQKQVAFPFGYGLSYTTFGYSDLAVSTDGTKLDVSLKVTNTGKVAGKEAVQVYIHQVAPTLTRPPKELKAFSKHLLKPGETTTVKYSLDVKNACSYFREYKNKWVLEAGKYEVHVGSSSDDIHLIGEFEVKKTVFWTGL